MGDLLSCGSSRVTGTSKSDGTCPIRVIDQHSSVASLLGMTPGAMETCLHTDLIALPRCVPVVGEGEPPAVVDGSVLSDRCLLLRYLTAQGKDDRLLLINLGRDLVIASLADPLFAPPEFHQWTIVWSSEDVRYGGGGQQRPADLDRRWVLPGNTALLLTPEARGPQRVPSAKDVADWQEHLIG